MARNESPTNIELQTDVSAALRSDGAVDSALGVSAHEGVVTLSGSVTDAAERTAALTVARQVPGVTLVSNEIAARYRDSHPSRTEQPRSSSPRSARPGMP